MSADIIRADYIQLEQIANRFVEQAELLTITRQKVESRMDALRTDGFIGESATAFYGEMESSILPSFTRLISGFEDASESTKRIILVLSEAEEEASTGFMFGDGGGAGSDSTRGTANLSSSPMLTPDQMESNVDRVFSEEYMEDFIGKRIQGENSAELNSAMSELYSLLREGNPNNQTKIDQLLGNIADIRGIDRADFKAQWERFTELSGYPESYKGHINDNLHDYFGHTAQLRFGAVVGDVVGIDPVFGAMLNPTGGRVGSGSDSYVPSENDAIGYHGTFHDAAGFLYNEMPTQVGNGYNYLERTDPFSTSSPLSGQVGGISWWVGNHPELSIDISQANQLIDIPFVPEFMEADLADMINDSGFVHNTQTGMYIYEGGSNMADGIGDIIDGDFSSGIDNIIDGSESLGVGAGRVVNDTFRSIFRF